VKTADFQKRTALLLEEANKQGLRGPDALLKVLETEQGKRIAAGGDTKLMVTAGRAQQAAALTMDAVVARFNGAAQLNKSAAETFRDAVQTFTRQKVPGGVPGQEMVPPTAANTRGPGFAAGAGAGGVTNPTGARVFQGGIMGGIESFVTQGRGFRSYAQSAQDVASLFDFRGGVTGNRENLDKLEPGFRDRLTRMAAEYNQLTQGKKIPFGSGQRSQEQNAQVGGVGTSLHMEGRAADLSADVVQELKKMGLLDRYGFKQNPRSGWHISDTGYRFGGIASGPKSGYTAVLHGTEAVIPMPNGQSIKVDMPDFADGIKGQMDVMSAQLHRLDDLVQIMRNQNAISSKILQVSQS
jgi:hypothetical protein